jgi:hypothetical protein
LGQLSEAVDTCLSGGLAGLGSCLTGIVNLGGDEQAAATCSSFLGLGQNDPTGSLGSQCFTSGGADVSAHSFHLLDFKVFGGVSSSSIFANGSVGMLCRLH